MVYIKQLDSIRGIGILLVAIFHWLPVDQFYNTWPNRPFGVDVFFVLSGFLITNILLQSRADNRPKMRSFVSFYFKRSLRIFPVYFLVLFLVMATHQSLGATVDGELIRAATFTLNFHFYQHQYWGDLTTHLWTLSIEEQFYLVWPFVILLFRTKSLPWVMGAFILAGFASQCLINDMEFGYLPTNTCVDAFAIGGLMAWAFFHQCERFSKVYSFLKWLGTISLIVLAVAAAFPDLFFLAPQRSLRSLVAAWAIGYVVLRHSRGTIHAAWVFNNRALLFIGKISYGMYLYHIFLPWTYYPLNESINQLLPSGLHPYLSAITFLENMVLLVIISWMSWRYFERPLLMLGKFLISPGGVSRMVFLPPLKVLFSKKAQA